MAKTVRLDRQEIVEAIDLGDSGYGRRWLVVRPTGDTFITWADNNRQWDPWQDEDYRIAIPALNPDGSGEESEDAEDMLRAIGKLDEAEALIEAEDIGYAEAAERLAPADWKENRAVSLDWLADAFLAACNGDGSDLNWPTPWGITWTDEYSPEEAIEPPFKFEWK